jgi:DNA-binding NtrC family response regulator
MEALRATVLVVDDDPDQRMLLASALAKAGYAAEQADNATSAISTMSELEPDVVLTDLHMPGGGGLAVVEAGCKRLPHATFVVLTAFASVETAIRAIRLGAEHYLPKPVDLDSLLALVERGVARARTAREADSLRSELGRRRGLGAIVGDHPSMQRLLKTVERVANSRATVLVTGESGTGKELIAAAIHQASPRARGPFVAVNCAALAESLLESELFGHEKGAFTGAARQHVGRFEQASGGTLLLDEVSEIPLPLQVKLLRVLQERRFERVGGERSLEADVRIVAATNRPLRDRVAAGSFREDLFYRLAVVELEVPPLRARPSDIPLLAQHFLGRHTADAARDLVGFTEAAMALLVAHSWPGNVRELENAIERATVLCESDRIDVAQLEHLRAQGVRGDMGLLVPGLTLAELERLAIERTLSAVGGSTAKAAELLGISQRTIQIKLKQWASEND